MLYKTIVLELLEQNPELHERLRNSRMLLATLDLYASMLATRHQAWERQIATAKPDSGQNQIASEALELAIEEMRTCLVSVSPDGSVPQSLDDAMIYIQRHLPRE